MQVALNYGKRTLKLSLPRQNLAQVIRKKKMPVITRPGQSLLASLDRPLGTKPLQAMVKNKRSAVIVISDLTRPFPTPKLLPSLLGYLEKHGISRQKITILIANGVHQPLNKKQIKTLVGPRIIKAYRIINHNARDKKSLKALGKTRHGRVPIYLNKHYLQADLRILTGVIEPHFMAGYSGGRKSICPGLCGLETMKHVHGVKMLASAQSASGVLKRNPFHQASLEVAQKARVDFIVNVVLTESKEISGIFAGDLVKAHLAGIRFFERYGLCTIKKPVDIVVTSNGGYPLDVNFYQTVKGLVDALGILKPNGTIIMASRCQEGLGSPEFVSLLTQLTYIYDDFLTKFSKPKNFVLDQWEVQEMIKVFKKAKVLLYSECLSLEETRLAKVQKISSLEEGLGLALLRHGSKAKVAVIPEGPYVVSRLKS